MKIALVNPPFVFPEPRQMALSHCLGLRYISASLKAAGHDVQFVDALLTGFDNVKPYASGIIVGEEPEDTAARIAPNTELVGLSVPFSQLAPIAHGLADAVKARLPDATLVMGGVYPSTQPQLALTSCADAIVVGEGEQAMGALAAGEAVDEVPGVYTAPPSDSESYEGTVVEDLDALPRPDDDIPDMERYFRLSPRMARSRPTASIVTSRGCPFDCEFCSVHPVCGRRWRALSASRVAGDIAYWAGAHDVRAFEIEDDNFTLDAARAAEILRGIVHLNEQGKEVSWSAPNGVRIDTLHDELIGLIARSHCTRLVVALEHGDPDMLRDMNKKLDLGQAYEAIASLVRAGVRRIVVFIIVGYPGETRERFENSLAFLRRLRDLSKRIAPCINVAQPYPGTRLLERCRAEGIITDPHFGNFLERPQLLSTSATVPITTSDFDAAEILRRHREILKALPDASWPARVVRAARRVLRPGNTQPCAEQPKAV